MSSKVNRRTVGRRPPQGKRSEMSAKRERREFALTGVQPEVRKQVELLMGLHQALANHADEWELAGLRQRVYTLLELDLEAPTVVELPEEGSFTPITNGTESSDEADEALS